MNWKNRLGKSFRAGISSASSSNAAQSKRTATIDIPKTLPGWNINAEEYFTDILKPLAETEISVYLEIVDPENEGWDETNVLFKGSKIGQLPNTYHQRMAPALRKLRSSGSVLGFSAIVTKDLDVKLLAPFPEKLLPYISGDTDVDLKSREKKSIRLKETRKYQTQLLEVWSLTDSADWSGTVKISLFEQETGKYAGQKGVIVLHSDTAIGSIGPRFADDLSPILAQFDRGIHEFECRISKSQFEDGQVYATLFAPGN